MQFPPYRLAQASIGLLLIIVIRTLGQVLWADNPAVASLGQEHSVYITGAFLASVAAMVALILHAMDRDRLAMLLTAMTVVALLVYKVCYLF
jgi:hypothetical protein